MEITARKVQNKILNSFRKFEFYRRGRNMIKNSVHASPDFMIIGAAKSGTTSLFQYLAQHSDIITPKNKEIRYFGMHNQINGLKWYLSQYPLKAERKEGMLTFEATPTYLYLKRAPKEISFLYPQMQSIVILRDPVKRAYSHWTWQQKHSAIINKDLIDKRTFEQAVEQEIKNVNSVHLYAHRYLDRGKYAMQLERWYKYYNKNQILILDFEDLKSNLLDTMATVTRFLGIEDIYGNFKVGNEKVQGVLQKKDQEDSGKLKKYNSSNYKESLNKETEEQLRAFFAPFDDDLERLTGRKFSWMK